MWSFLREILWNVRIKMQLSHIWSYKQTYLFVLPIAKWRLIAGFSNLVLRWTNAINHAYHAPDLICMHSSIFVSHVRFWGTTYIKMALYNQILYSLYNLYSTSWILSITEVSKIKQFKLLLWISLYGNLLRIYIYLPSSLSYDLFVT